MTSLVAPEKTPLGIAGVVVAVLGLAMTAQAQTESYITDADEAASCEGVCNTYVPPQDEAECRALAAERWQAEYQYNISRVARIQSLYDSAMESSLDIYTDELGARVAVRNERQAKANAAASLAIVAAKAQLTKCVLAADLIPTPGNIAAAAKCMGWYSLAMAGIITTLNRATDDILNDFQREGDILCLEASQREDRFKDRRDLSLKAESERNETQLALIELDLELCLARVNN